MKGLQRIVSILLVILSVVTVMPVGILSAKNVYDDVKEEHWFYEPIMYVKDKGLMVGTKENAFSPFMTTNRAMLVTILHRLEGTPKAIQQDLSPTQSFIRIGPRSWVLLSRSERL